MVAKSDLQFAGEYLLEECRIITTSGKRFDIKPIVEEINIYENIYTSAISGSILVKDATNIVNNFMIAYVGDGAWGMSMAETLTCVRENIPVTAVVFNNGQWGAEKKNQVLWFNNKYIGTQLDNPSFAEIANAMGAKGIKVSDKQSLSEALHESINNQKNGKTTIIEVMVTKELGEPFRRDAMKLPNRFLDKYSDDIVIAESSSGQPTDL